jgi:hypothetical protein
MKINSGAVYSPVSRKAIAFVVTLALIAGLLPLMGTSAVYAADDGGIKYTQVALTKAQAASVKVDPRFDISLGKDIISSTGALYKFIKTEKAVNLSAYYPFLDVFVPDVDGDRYITKKGIAIGAPWNLTNGAFTEKIDLTQVPHKSQATQSAIITSGPNKGLVSVGAILDDQTVVWGAIAKKPGSTIEPFKFGIKDTDPSSAYKLQFDVHYSPDYGQLLFNDPEFAQNVSSGALGSQIEKALGEEAGIAFAAFDALYPLISQNVQALNIDGALDNEIYENLPFLVEYLKTDDGKNLTTLGITSTVPVPTAAAVYWSNPKNFDKRTNANLSNLTVNLKLQNDANSKKLAAAIAEHTKKVSLTIIDKNGKVIKKAVTINGASQINSLKTAVKTIYVQKGKTIKIPYVAYANKGYTNKKVSVVWTSTKPKVASVVKNKKTGTIKTGKLDGKSVLKVKAAKVGSTKITVKVDNKKKITYNVKVLAKKKVKAVKSFKLSKVKQLKHGKTKYIKVSKITKNAVGLPTFTIAKKYKKFLAVDAAGKLTAKKAYKKGKKAIPVKVKIGKKSKTLKVKVK